MKSYGLVADVGGTNVRFGLVDLSQPGRVALQTPRKLISKSYAGMLDAARSYLTSIKPDAPLTAAVFAVAGPVHNEEISLTNLRWHFTAADLQAGLQVEQVHLLNDYEAIAYAAPSLGADDLMDIGAFPKKTASAEQKQVIGIVGPGTGLGVAGYQQTPEGIFPLVTEGGHADFAPVDDVEIEILKLVGHGMFNKEIANKLGIAVSTVKNHLHAIFEKLQVTRRRQAVLQGLALGVLTCEPKQEVA